METTPQITTHYADGRPSETRDLTPEEIEDLTPEEIEDLTPAPEIVETPE